MHTKSLPMIALVLVGGVTSSACTREGSVAYVRHSQGSGMTVTVTGILTPPSSLWVEHVVRADVTRHVGGSIQVELHRGDSFDKGFSEMYSEPEWLPDPALRWPSVRARTLPPSELIVENRTTQAVPCLRVGAEDLFLIFDLQPGSKLTLSASSQPPSELTFFKAEGCGPSSATYQYQSKDFQQLTPLRGWTGRYVLRVESTGLVLALEPARS